jgi:hypothetical protein
LITARLPWVSLVVTADATAFPDLDVLMAGMERDWQALVRALSRRAQATEYSIPKRIPTSAHS